MIKIKTLIELFDSCQIENVIAGLKFLPQKIVFVGFKEVMTQKRMRDLEKFFGLRKLNVQLEYIFVERYDYKSIYNKLNEIVDMNEDCCFDLTGGKELVLTAMGAVSAVREIPMVQFNVRTGNLIRVKNSDNFVETGTIAIKIKESVVLNGGAVVDNEKQDFNWDLNDEFKKDIDTIWGICKGNCGLWNRQSNVFDNFEKFGRIEDELRLTVNLNHMKNCKQDTFLSKKIVGSLIKNKFITDYSLVDGILTFKYKNSQIKECIIKAGNILELYVYKTAKEIALEEPSFYDDIDVGIFVDWDGNIHNEACSQKDTRNEIDVILMKDLVPIFISCKNGEVKKEALYELSTMADRFGGEYARKVLLATYINNDDESRKAIKQRAQDMNISIIDNVDKMSKEDFIATLRKRTK